MQSVWTTPNIGNNSAQLIRVFFDYNRRSTIVSSVFATWHVSRFLKSSSVITDVFNLEDFGSSASSVSASSASQHHQRQCHSVTSVSVKASPVTREMGVNANRRWPEADTACFKIPFWLVSGSRVLTATQVSKFSSLCSVWTGPSDG